MGKEGDRATESGGNVKARVEMELRGKNIVLWKFRERPVSFAKLSRIALSREATTQFALVIIRVWSTY